MVTKAGRISDIRGLQSDDRLYFRDLYDSLNRISELVDSYRDLLSGATDMYLSTVANRQGESTRRDHDRDRIPPLTFLTGFFGQNAQVYALAGAGSSSRRGSSVSRAITNRCIWAVPS